MLPADGAVTGHIMETVLEFILECDEGCQKCRDKGTELLVY